MILRFKSGRTRAIFGTLVAALLLLGAVAAWLSRRGHINFSNGSWLSIREVVYSRNAVYFHEPIRRLISRNSQAERGWAWLNLQFPGLAKRLRITSVNSMAQGRLPALVVFGDAMIVPEGERFCEFVGVDSTGRESAPLKMPALDNFESLAKNRPKAGPCILAMRQSLPGEPQFVRVYEVEKKRSSRRLLATLKVRIAPDAAGTSFPIAPEGDENDPPQTGSRSSTRDRPIID